MSTLIAPVVDLAKTESGVTEGAAACPARRPPGLPHPRRRSSRSPAPRLGTGSERRRGTWVRKGTPHSPPAVRRRRIVTGERGRNAGLTAGGRRASPRWRCAPPARHRAAGSGHDRPRGDAARARARARGPRHRGDAAAVAPGGSWSARRRPDSARPRRRAGRAPEAAEAGCRVRRAAPGPLSATSGSAWCAPPPEAAGDASRTTQRARLLEGAAAPAGALLLDRAVPSADATMAIADSVLVACAAPPTTRRWSRRGRRRPGPTARRSRWPPTSRGGSASCRC